MTRLDHIGIAVRSLASAKIYEDLGLTIDHVETVETQRVKTAFLSAGDSTLELLAAKGSITSACASRTSRRTWSG